MLQIHRKARPPPAVRAEIARSAEPSGMLAKRYGVSTETIRKWRTRGPADCQDHSARPHKLPWKARASRLKMDSGGGDGGRRLMIPHDREIDHGPELFLGFAGAHRGARAGRAFSP